MNIFKNICCIYKKLAKDFAIEDYKDLVTIMMSRDVINVEEHEYELISNYLGRCAMMFIEPKFEHLLNECQLTGLLKYKKESIHILEKIFIYYVEQGQYPIKPI